MAFFEQLGKKISDMGQGVAQQTKNFADVTRLNSAISDNEKAIAKIYSEIGKAYYEKHKEDALAEEAESINKINALFAEIKQHKDEINRIKGIAMCPNCGAEVVAGSTFCNACGQALPKNEPAPAASEGSFCPNCGTAVPAGNLFCSNCGTKI